MCDTPLYNSVTYFKNALRNVSKILKHTSPRNHIFIEFYQYSTIKWLHNWFRWTCYFFRKLVRFATSIVEVLKAIIFEKDLIAQLIWKSW